MFKYLLFLGLPDYSDILYNKMDTTEGKFICIINIDWIKLDFIVIYLVLYFKTGKIGEEPNKCIEKATEQIDENGIKYIVYEANTVDIDENAEVNIYIPT